ncbi:MAG: hypothetical protein BA862_08270 [Desulfobulbaceae bacterium S3730MH12]|nr:MAG: hypothetical protein BA866_03675 [Desulfobulbaceae bacterium S5133MH15]OEU56400.1 MAG: hypothetical protein BA862_08270 [Desulfobulbaceae bacterium S3730MH12]OEU82345.1 MAG: hypothetical protein BA873_09100 [Desulfobulbaceae bacterium C00003063]
MIPQTTASEHFIFGATTSSFFRKNSGLCLNFLLFFQEVNDTGRTEFTIYFRIRTFQAPCAEIMLVLRTVISAFHLWVIFTLSHYNRTSDVNSG